MFFGKTRLFFRQLFRLFEILGVIIRHSFREWVSHQRYLRKYLKSVDANQEQVSRTPERLRLAIEELGPTFIKFGQILADRPDLITANFRKELKKLQATAKPISDSEGIDLIEIELGDSIENVFSSFNKKHIASASIGQVYTAVLKNGKKVAIKIQRPNIEDKIRLDLLLMTFLAKKMVKRYPELAVMDVVTVIEEFNKSIFDELNYLNEASNIVRFRQMFENDERVHIPEVYHDYTTKRILVMEFVDGISPDKLDEMEAAGIDRKIIANTGADVLLTQILKHGFFHADPHAGNIFVLPGNVISFIDFGMVGNLKQRHIHFIAEFTLGLLRKDPKNLAKAMLKLSDIKYFDQMEELEFEMEKIIQRFGYLPVKQINIASVLQESVNVIVRFRLKIPSSFFMLLKSIATIEKFAIELDPELALVSIMKKHAVGILKKRYGIKQMASNLYNAVGDYFNLIRDFPSEVNEILYKVKEGKLIHEVDLKNTDFFRETLITITYRISIVVLLGFLLIGGVMVTIWGDPSKGLSKFIVWFSAILSFVIVIKWGLKSLKSRL